MPYLIKCDMISRKDLRDLRGLLRAQKTRQAHMKLSYEVEAAKIAEAIRGTEEEIKRREK